MTRKLVRATVPMCPECEEPLKYESGYYVGSTFFYPCGNNCPSVELTAVDWGYYVDDAPDAALREVVREALETIKREIPLMGSRDVCKSVNAIGLICKALDHMEAALADKAEEGHDG